MNNKVEKKKTMNVLILLKLTWEFLQNINATIYMYLYLYQRSELELYETKEEEKN